MSIQWHPLYAHLLSLLVDAFYEVDTEVPVSDLPRRGDILLLRRTGSATPPFDGLWSNLTDWNVQEFKGPTDAAEVSDLELLLHVGTGITYRFNEERRQCGEEPLPNHRVSFWYLAPSLGETFMGAARQRTHLEYEGGGLWRGRVWGHPLFFVSYRDVGAEPDALPLHVLTGAPQVGTGLLAELFKQDIDLWNYYGKWLQAFQIQLWEDIRHMVPTLPASALIDWEEVAKHGDITPLIQTLDPKRAIQVWGVERAIEVIGLERLMESVSPEQLIQLVLSKLSPEQQQQLRQRLSGE